MTAKRDLPGGTVTFVFTDVEGSTKLLHALGAEAYADALATHRRILRDAFNAHGGVEVDTQGDAFFVAFPTAPGALAAAAQARDALSGGPIRVRIGLHTGTPHLTHEGYVGADVHRAARIAAAGHGGQVLLSSATAPLVDVELHDLGDHRLKDLSAPERIFQLGDDDHPPLKSLHQTNLPVPATPFLGREAELADLERLLTDGGARVLTLTGPGGTGKTRLALQAAASAADAFPGGVWWVPLAPLRDHALVVTSVAAALGASGDLAEHIGDKKLLILLDNFEQVVEAAVDLAPLLAGCPNLSLLVTSREPLHLGGEHEYAVDPLRQPDAIELFMTRALAARRDVAADGEVAQICERLDNLPLAIELAAARVKVLSPLALLERLEQRLPMLAGGARDLPERQRTLRATIEWSHELLNPDEQRLFARMSVFRGGSSLEAAEAVADADLDILQSLVDKSLVRVRDDRYWMLETIREFAAERLEASGAADEIGRRHAEFFLGYADAESGAFTENAKAWADRLEREHDNLRAALDWLEAAGKSQSLLRLAGALAEFWYTRGHVAEGKRRLERAVASDPRPTAARAAALNGASLMNVEGGGDAARAGVFAEEALAIYRELGDESGVAYSILTLAEAFSDAGDWKAAQRHYEDSRQRFQDLGDDHHVLLATRLLAWMHFELGNSSQARAMHEENLARARALGNQRIVGTTLGALGEYDIRGGRVADALPKLKEAYEIYRDLGHPLEIAVELCRFAWALVLDNRPGDAARVFARSLLMYEEMATAVPAWVVPMNDEILAAIHAGLDDAEFGIATEEGRRLTIDEAVALAVETSPSS
jgi:predicted ATPase/class 3 adenylate cyclase